MQFQNKCDILLYFVFSLLLCGIHRLHNLHVLLLNMIPSKASETLSTLLKFSFIQSNAITVLVNEEQFLVQSWSCCFQSSNVRLHACSPLNIVSSNEHQRFESYCCNLSMQRASFSFLKCVQYSVIYLIHKFPTIPIICVNVRLI